MQLFLIIVALALVATFVFVKVRERREAEAGGAPTSSTTLRDEPVVDDDDDDLDGLDIELDDDEPSILAKSDGASSAWLEDLAVRDDRALDDLRGAPVEDEPLDEVATTGYDALDTDTVDEEFVSLTADLEVDDEPVIVKEDVETADDIMANSKATEINPAGNTELQKLLAKVQDRLAQYE